MDIFKKRNRELKRLAETLGEVLPDTCPICGDTPMTRTQCLGCGMDQWELLALMNEEKLRKQQAILDEIAKDPSPPDDTQWREPSQWHIDWQREAQWRSQKAREALSGSKSSRGLQTDRDEMVRKHPSVRDGRPCIRNTHFLISQLLAELACSVREDRQETLADICDDYDLDMQDVRDALNWVALNVEKLK